MNTERKLNLAHELPAVGSADALNRSSLDLREAAGIIELVRYWVEAEAWHAEASDRLGSNNLRVAHPMPGDVDASAVSAVLYEAYSKINGAREFIETNASGGRQ
ncbi:MAG: hypothetical protein M0015_05915 [Betaproteobacteria bacterium]|nr:hypothetical protein [Betaproteobacteria bacterium]